MRYRSHRTRATRDEALAEADRSAPGPGPAVVHRHPEAGAILDLQRTAGNRAVAASVGSWQNGRVVLATHHVKLKTFPHAPSGGLKKLRDSAGGKGIFGRTQASIEPSPPLLRPEAPVKTEAGWTCRPKSARVPEPHIDESWITEGRHDLAPRIHLDVSADMERTLKAGEDEHVADTVLGWKETWGKVGAAINELAKQPGPARPTEKDAIADLWSRFLHLLPADLRPAGAEPTDEAQLARWGFEPKTTLFRRLFGATEQRDARNWHLPATDTEISGKDEYRRLEKGSMKIGEISSQQLIDEIRAAAKAG